MHVKCSKCSQSIALTDIIESSDGCVSHVDCRRPQTLTAEERALLFVYCFNHAVARCFACDVSLRFMELGADPLGGRSNLCPRCRRDLTENVRSHLYRCTTLPSEVRLAAQAVRETAQHLLKQSHHAMDRSDVLIQQAEVSLFESQKRLRAAMARRLAS